MTHSSDNKYNRYINRVRKGSNDVSKISEISRSDEFLINRWSDVELVVRFFSERCKITNAIMTPVGAVYDYFNGWLKNKNKEADVPKLLVSVVLRLLCTKVIKKNSTFHFGLKILRSEEEERLISEPIPKNIKSTIKKPKPLIYDLVTKDLILLMDAVISHKLYLLDN